MSPPIVDFSAQFGGRDEAALAPPHFKAPKAAARGLRLAGFHPAELAFIPRIDGEIKRLGPSGAENLEIDRRGQYPSIDIVVAGDDRGRIHEVIPMAILSSTEQIIAAN